MSVAVDDMRRSGTTAARVNVRLAAGILAINLSVACKNVNTLVSLSQRCQHTSLVPETPVVINTFFGPDGNASLIDCKVALAATTDSQIGLEVVERLGVDGRQHIAAVLSRID